jgi:uncharacterized membrane protein
MIKSSIVVDRPIEAVFDYAAQFEKHPEWQPDLRAATFTGPPSVGATGTETRKMGPQTHTYEWRVTEYSPSQRLGFETLSGPMRPSGTMTFTSEAADRTRVDFEMAMNPRGFMKVMAPLIERRVAKTNQEHLQRFKQLLESPA